MLAVSGPRTSVADNDWEMDGLVQTKRQRKGLEDPETLGYV